MNTIMNLLATTFSRLRLLGNAVEVKIVEPLLRSLGTYSSATKLPTGHEMMRTHEARRPVEWMIEALVVSSMMVDKFTIAFQEARWEFGLLGLCRTPEYAQRLFAGLKKLHLRFSRVMLYTLTDRGPVHKAFGALSAAQGLELLWLGNYDDGKPLSNHYEKIDKHAGRYAFSVIWSLSFPALKDLHVHSCVVDAGDFSKFLKQYLKLKSVDLKRTPIVTLIAEEDLSQERPIRMPVDTIVKSSEEETGFEGLRVEDCIVWVQGYCEVDGDDDAAE